MWKNVRLRQLQGYNIFHPSSVIIINKSDFPFNPTHFANLYDNLRMIYDLLWCALFLLLWLSAGNMFFNFNHAFVFPHERRLVSVQFGGRRDGTGLKDVWQRKLHETNKQKITIKYFTTPEYITYIIDETEAVCLCVTYKRVTPLPGSRLRRKASGPGPGWRNKTKLYYYRVEQNRKQNEWVCLSSRGGWWVFLFHSVFISCICEDRKKENFNFLFFLYF